MRLPLSGPWVFSSPGLYALDLVPAVGIGGAVAVSTRFPSQRLSRCPLTQTASKCGGDSYRRPGSGRRHGGAKTDQVHPLSIATPATRAIRIKGQSILLRGEFP